MSSFLSHSTVRGLSESVSSLTYGLAEARLYKGTRHGHGLASGALVGHRSFATPKSNRVMPVEQKLLFTRPLKARHASERFDYLLRSFGLFCVSTNRVSRLGRPKRPVRRLDGGVNAPRVCLARSVGVSERHLLAFRFIYLFVVVLLLLQYVQRVKKYYRTMVRSSARERAECFDMMLGSAGGV